MRGVKIESVGRRVRRVTLAAGAVTVLALPAAVAPIASAHSTIIAKPAGHKVG